MDYKIGSGKYVSASSRNQQAGSLCSPGHATSFARGAGETISASAVADRRYSLGWQTERSRRGDRFPINVTVLRQGLSGFFLPCCCCWPCG
jgi:hypothetical protein